MIEKLELSLNTVGKHQRNLKTFMKEAFDRNLTDNRDFMKREFKVVTEKVDDVFLDEKEIQLLTKLDLRKTKRLERVRDLFVLNCWWGLRYADLKTLSEDNIVEKNGKFNLVITTQKTEKKVEIPLLENSLSIIHKYRKETGFPFPRPYSNQKMNSYLKEVCEMIPELYKDFVTTTFKKGARVKIKTPKYSNISTHSARRSFVSNMLKKGLQQAIIMRITGHSSEKSFNRYIKINGNDFAEMMREQLEA
jgi:integrase